MKSGWTFTMLRRLGEFPDSIPVVFIHCSSSGGASSTPSAVWRIQSAESTGRILGDFGAFVEARRLFRLRGATP
jgi:hypothetical protein